MGKTDRSGGGSGPRAWTWEEKLQAVTEAAELDDQALGAFLREKGVHEAQLQEWREMIASALDHRSPPSRKQDQQRIRKLEKKLRETTALLELAKKVHELWGDEDDDTLEKSGR